MLRKPLWVISVLLLASISAPAAHADTVSMDLTGVGNGASDYGVYLSPYTATVNGVANTSVICDDFANDSYLGESWTANVSNVASLGNVLWPSSSPAQQQVLYDEMAYLAYQLGNPTNANAQAAISFAIWDLSDSSAVSAWSSAPGYSTFLADSGNSNGVLYWVDQAQNQYGTLSSTQLADVLVYSPDTSDPITCGTGPCQNTPPQEFLAINPVATPEPGTFVLMLMGLGSLGLMMAVRKRTAERHQQTAWNTGPVVFARLHA